MKLSRITGFRLVTSDGDRLTRFYAALGFEADAEQVIESEEMMMLGISGRGARRTLRIGEARIDLDQYAQAGNSYPANADAASGCFQHIALVTGDVAACWSKAKAAGAIAISKAGPVVLPPSSGGVTAVKFRDPDGHPLEFIRFPDMTAKGWKDEGLQGIDHSAVVVTNRTKSEAFYSAAGLAAGKVSQNRGREQDALDGLTDARVDVVPMMPAQAAPHVELLCYRCSSRDTSQPWAPQDVAATRILWQSEAPALLRDPTGHLHQLLG